MAGAESGSALHTRCCIAGGGPAGLMLGLLLARAGVEVLVLEKHADFLRDFRGDTVHPSTMEILDQLGLLDDFLARPHQELREVSAVISGERLTLADFQHLPTRAKFIALMPQWDFLNFLAEHARKLPAFALALQREVVGLIEEGGRVVGLRALGPQGPLEVRCDLVVGADGRGSAVRALAGLEVQDLGAPIDVLWMRISRREGDPQYGLGVLSRGRLLVMLDRGDYWQCAFVIRKDGFEALRAQGLAELRAELAELAPFLRERMAELASWDDVKLLTVRVDRLREWSRPGLLCIGDAAHAMSPVGGVGINLAIQDAVAAANALAGALGSGAPSPEALRSVQRRRELPTRVVQRVQVLIHENVIAPTLRGRATPRAPGIVRLVDRLPLLRRIPARLVGLGFRRERVSERIRSRPSRG
ncbi:MAG TPA: FAD-dependent oxidoreductase [Myxococcota bacterium]|nr:FAD-dependent oxidoreductase [Myxococcota bacterium]